MGIKLETWTFWDHPTTAGVLAEAHHSQARNCQKHELAPASLHLAKANYLSAALAQVGV